MEYDLEGLSNDKVDYEVDINNEYHYIYPVSERNDSEKQGSADESRD